MFYKKKYEPVTSYGIIAMKVNNFDIGKNNNINAFIRNLKKNVKFLMIQRKHTYEFIEFVRGKYETHDRVMEMFRNMTSQEIDKIMENYDNFDVLWKELWRRTSEKLFYTFEYKTSKEKFNNLFKNENHMLDILYSLKTPNIILEWGFPKGRKNKYETNLECAMREFEEETNVSKNDYKVINCEPYFEIFYGNNNVKYKYVYYLAVLTTPNDVDMKNYKFNDFQLCEIGNIGLYNFYEALKLIDNYYVERKKIISKINKFLIHMQN